MKGWKTRVAVLFTMEALVFVVAASAMAQEAVLEALL